VISQARLKFLRSLRLKKTRAQEGVLLAEGLNVVEEAITSGAARELLLTDAVAGSPRGRALMGGGIPTLTLNDREAQSLAQTRTPPGVFALVDDPCRPLASAQLPDETLALFAAGVADPGNLGTLIRSAAALGAHAVVVNAASCEPTNPKVVRATAGALFRLPIVRGEATELKAAGFALLLADAAGRPVAEFTTRRARLALIVGNEPHGADDETRALADDAIAVPLRSGVESLNVAVAAGILLHALVALRVTVRP